MDELACTGDEARLADCPFLGIGQLNCEGNDFVEVTCQENDPDPIPTQGDIRLTNIQDGDSEVRGQVEVFRNGYWVRVCDDGFDILDAAVACRQLNYSAIGKCIAIAETIMYLITCVILIFDLFIF